MERLYGFLEKGYRFEIKVPTTIFDPRRAEITAYRGRRHVIDKIFAELEGMPHWDVPAQAIMLSKRDEQKVQRNTRVLLHRLPERRDILSNYCNND